MNGAQFESKQLLIREIVYLKLRLVFFHRPRSPACATLRVIFFYKTRHTPTGSDGDDKDSLKYLFFSHYYYYNFHIFLLFQNK